METPEYGGNCGEESQINTKCRYSRWRVGNENGVLTVVEQPCQYAPQAGQEQETRQSGD